MYAALWSLVVFHTLVIVGNIFSFFILPFVTPWYIAIPIMSYLLSILTLPTPCPLTKLEDHIRIHLGMPPIKHFVGFYFVWPLKRKFRKKRNRIIVVVPQEECCQPAPSIIT